MDTGYRRAALIPPWLLPTLLAILLIAAGYTVWSFTRTRAGLERVPNVKGLELPMARSRLVLAGFEVREGDRRFSATVPKGAVLDQQPAPGSLAPKGTPVVVAISNGSERFPMPDVTGIDVERARQQLRGLGLEVRVETVASEQPRNIVLSSFPAPNAQVSTADAVQLTVSAGNAGGDSLLPVDLAGKRFVLDPSVMPSATPSAPSSVSPEGVDVPAQVARRLQSLLQASGAEVVVTRSSVATLPVAEVDRALIALQANATAVFGIDVAATGEGGLAVSILPPDQAQPSVYIGSVDLARTFSKEFRAAGRGVRTLPATPDPVLLGGKTVGVRVILGSLAAKGDAALFADPSWADAIARDMYRAIGATYGPR